MATDSSRTTHQAQEAIDACRYLAGLLIGAVRGIDKETLLSPGYCPVGGPWGRDPLGTRSSASLVDRSRIATSPTSRERATLLTRSSRPCGHSTAPTASARAPCCGEPRRRRRHDWSDLRTDRRRLLRSRGDSSALAGEADNGGRDQIAGRPPPRPGRSDLSHRDLRALLRAQARAAAGERDSQRSEI